MWLVVASGAGLTASVKLHEPDWLVQQAWLTFGRIRTIHLNAVAYGWAPMAGLGITMFVIRVAQDATHRGAVCAGRCGVVERGLDCRTGQHRVRYQRDGMEWLEIPGKLT